MADEQNGISEWKCIPEWNFRMEVHSRVEVRSGSEFQSGNIYVELNGPYMGFRIYCYIDTPRYNLSQAYIVVIHAVLF